MKTRTFHLAMAVWLGVAAALLGGCDRDGREVVETERDAQGGVDVHVDGDEVEQNLERAGEELQAAGEQLERGAERVGAAVERGAERIEREVGPVAREVISDASITAKVKAKLIADPEINPFHIDVDTVDGQVTLNGKVNSQEIKDEAQKLAEHTDGVLKVNNLIQVASAEQGTGG